MLRLHCSPDLPEPPSLACRQGLRALAGRVLAEYPAGGPVDAVLTGDEELRRLNATYRGRDRPTDVLSFPLAGGPPATGASAAEAVPVGEIYISLERAAAQAAALKVPPEEELARLLVHGLLHLAGCDHQTEEDLAFMERETERFLAGVE